MGYPAKGVTKGWLPKFQYLILSFLWLVGETMWITWYKITCKDTSQTMPLPEGKLNLLSVWRETPECSELAWGQGDDRCDWTQLSGRTCIIHSILTLHWKRHPFGQGPWFSRMWHSSIQGVGSKAGSGVRQPNFSPGFTNFHPCDLGHIISPV